MQRPEHAGCFDLANGAGRENISPSGRLTFVEVLAQFFPQRCRHQVVSTGRVKPKQFGDRAFVLMAVRVTLKIGPL